MTNSKLEKEVSRLGRKLDLAVQIADTLVKLEDEQWNGLDYGAKTRTINRLNTLLKRYKVFHK